MSSAPVREPATHQLELQRIPRRTPETNLPQRLQLLIDAVSDYGIFVLDTEGHVQSWNAGAARLKGYTRDEIVGRHFSVFYPSEAVASGWPEEELRRARLHGRIEDEGWRLRKDGTRFWANVIITALRTPDGDLTGFAKITRDLSERRAQEEALRQSEQRMRLLVESVRDYAIFMLDPQGVVQSWNSGAQAIKGYTADDIIGRHFSTFYTPESIAAGAPGAELRSARELGRVESEGWRVRKDGTLFWANAVITAMHDADGVLVGFAKVTRDMSERRRLEELERSGRRMNEFLAMLAHELRNPLAPIRNAVTIMQLETLNNPVLRNCRDVIDRQLTHVTRLVDDLLDVGRLSTGKIKLRREDVRMSEVVRRSVEAVRPLADARRHTLEQDVPADPIHVQGDAVRLTQVVQNLLVNAAKYTPDGGRILLRVRQQEGFVTIVVQDNGRGIAQDDLERVFELFMQANQATGGESGLGIGLTLARTLVEMHGGSIQAQSAGPGQGSTFTVTLPAVIAPRAQPQKEGEVSSGGGLRVLVVDDNRDSADSATDILRLLGHRVEAAYEGLLAIESARQFKPDVVLLDLAMPGMDGFDALRQLRAQPGLAKVFVIAMTGFGNEDDKRRTRDAGFDAHLTKPVELDALIALLNDAGRKLRAQP